MNLRIITEIPTPYRNPDFERLNKECRRREIDFCVYFLAKNDPIRPASWFEVDNLNYPHKFFEGGKISFGHRNIYFNFSLIKDVLAMQDGVVMMAGLWNHFTTAAIALDFRRRYRLVGWLELNHKKPGIDNWITRVVRKVFIKRLDALALPGKSAEFFLSTILEMDYPTNLIMPRPNLIDEKKFRQAAENFDLKKRSAMRSLLGVGEDDLMAIWPARHIPEKAIGRFLRVLADSIEILRRNRWKVVILGDGVEFNANSMLIRKLGLEHYVFQKQNLDYDLMPNVYLSSDLFLLPSLEDANPLTVIESLISGLPLLISTGVGNHYEALEDTNGWLLDFDNNPERVRSTVREALETRPDKLKKMGAVSSKIYNSKWDIESSTQRQLDFIESRFKNNVVI